MFLSIAKRISLFFLVLTITSDSCSSEAISISTHQIRKEFPKMYQKQSDLLLSGFGKVFWDFLREKKSSDLKKIASDECISSLKDVFDLMDLREGSALRMVTASGRLPTNFFSGALADLGSFDQCLDPETTVDFPQRSKFMGQYCLAAVEPNFSRINHAPYDEVTGRGSFPLKDSLFPHQFNHRINMSVHIGFCVPSLCARTEVEHLISKALKPYSWELVKRLSCQTERNFTQMLQEASRAQKISLALLLIIVSMVLLSTILDFMRIERAQIRNHRLLEYIRCFSMKRTMGLLTKESDPHRMPCINFVRLISYPLEIVTHCVSWPMLIRAPFLSGTGLNPKFMKNWIAQPVLNSWYIEGVIILGAQSWMVKMWRETTNKTPMISYFSLIFERFRNNFIPLLTVICIDITLPLFGSGPIYQFSTGYMSGLCSRNFMYSLFYVMNFIPSSEMCVGHTWSMTVETQLFAIGCVVIFVYKRNSKLGLYLNLFLLMMGTGYLFFIFYSTDIPPQVMILPLDYETEGHLWSYMYFLLVISMIFLKMDEKISQVLLARLTKLMNLVLIVQLFSTGLWNVLDLKINNFWKAFYVLTYQYIVAVFWSLHFLAKRTNIQSISSPKSHKFVSREMRNDAAHPNRENGGDGLRVRKDSYSTEIGPELQLQENFYHGRSRKNDKISLKWIGQNVTILLRILRASYFIHPSFLTWYVSQRRESFPSDMASQIISLCGMATGCVLSGLIFYFFVFGPTESLISLRKKSHRA
ncbi:uncharacterized protein LOC141858795 isoform X2 [Brevipalpus obovatus]|uniref:uncharacterized protein LOC141858795 isoform X2 n=1 Tax=Brevipalpus obovatus TaxID=246614 RepID=UPI003D9F6C8E